MTTPRYLPLVGGVETHTAEVANRLATQGVDVSVLTLDNRTGWPRVEQHGGVTVQRFAGFPRRHDVAVAPALLRAVRTGGYDVVHVQGAHTLLAPAVLASAQRAGVPCVLTFHTGGHSSRIRAIVRNTQWRAMGPLLRRARALVAVSGFEQRYFSQLLGVAPERVRIIANGADPLPVGGEPARVTGSPLVASIGRLERYKGHARVMAAMPRLLELAPGAHLAIVGRGPDEARLRGLAGRMGVAHAVTFTSFAPDERPRLGSLLAATDVVALLSRYEAHPIAVLEALALGRKVVVADTTGLSELGAYDAVTVVDPHADADTLAEVLARVAGGPPPVPASLPTWDGCAGQVLALYSEILGQGRGDEPQPTGIDS